MKLILLWLRYGNFYLNVWSQIQEQEATDSRIFYVSMQKAWGMQRHRSYCHLEQVWPWCNKTKENWLNKWALDGQTKSSWFSGHLSLLVLWTRAPSDPQTHICPLLHQDWNLDLCLILFLTLQFFTASWTWDEQKNLQYDAVLRQSKQMVAKKALLFSQNKEKYSSGIEQSLCPKKESCLHTTEIIPDSFMFGFINVGEQKLTSKWPQPLQQVF